MENRVTMGVQIGRDTGWGDFLWETSQSSETCDLEKLAWECVFDGNRDDLLPRFVGQSGIVG